MFSSFSKMAWLAPVLLLGGCGGGGTSPDPDINGPAIVENSLSRSDFFDSQNDRYYDIYVCDARQNGNATVEMFSNDVDSYLLVYRKTSGGDFVLITQDDDSNDAGDARLDFFVERGRSYRIIATSASADERGDYDLRFSEELGRPARVLPDANRVSQSVVLPALPAKKKAN